MNTNSELNRKTDLDEMDSTDTELGEVSSLQTPSDVLDLDRGSRDLHGEPFGKFSSEQEKIARERISEGDLDIINKLKRLISDAKGNTERTTQLTKLKNRYIKLVHQYSNDPETANGYGNSLLWKELWTARQEIRQILNYDPRDFIESTQNIPSIDELLRQLDLTIENTKNNSERMQPLLELRASLEESQERFDTIYFSDNFWKLIYFAQLTQIIGRVTIQPLTQEFAVNLMTSTVLAIGSVLISLGIHQGVIEKIRSRSIRKKALHELGEIINTKSQL